MTNIELAVSLTGLAAVYAKPDNEAVKAPYVCVHACTKQELLAALRAIGGKFTKHMGDYNMRFESARLPGVEVSIDREKVCRKIVTWDCSPVLSDEDLMEVEKLAA